MATDSSEIENFCKLKNIPVVMTSDQHTTCTDRTSEAAQHLGCQYVLEIQGDEPTLLAKDMDKMIEKAIDENVPASILYTKLEKNLVYNQNIVKLVVDSRSRALYFSRSPIPCSYKEKEVDYFRQIGLYFWTTEFLKVLTGLPIGPLETIEETQVMRLVENKIDTLMVYTDFNPLGVDLPSDIEKAESILKRSI